MTLKKLSHKEKKKAKKSEKSKVNFLCAMDEEKSYFVLSLETQSSVFRW